MIFGFLIIFVIFKLEFSKDLIFNKNINDVIQIAGKSQTIYRRSPRHNAKNNSYRWLDAKVPYKIEMTNYTLDHVAKIEKSMKIIKNSTCIKFIKLTNETDFLTITGNSYHCGTKIGRRGGEQILSILDNGYCFQIVSIIHELLHILGFHHMHLSANRDDFIEIIWENVKAEKFNKFRIKENLQDLGVEYDYGSIMHYSEYAYSKNGERTIIPLKNVNGSTLGQREMLSDKDILRINRLYDCEIVNEILSNKIN